MGYDPRILGTPEQRHEWHKDCNTGFCSWVKDKQEGCIHCTFETPPTHCPQCGEPYKTVTAPQVVIARF